MTHSQVTGAMLELWRSGPTLDTYLVPSRLLFAPDRGPMFKGARRCAAFLPRCGKRKRSEWHQCAQPAVRGRRLCRWHLELEGAPDYITPPGRFQAARRPPAGEGGDGQIGAGSLRRILVALAQRNGLSDRQVAVRASCSSRSSTFRNCLSKARTRGWIEGNRLELRITAAGLDAVGSYDPLPTGAELAEHWQRQLGAGAPGRVFRELVRLRRTDRVSLAEQAGLSPESSTYRNALSKLRGLQLLDRNGDRLAAAEELY